MSLTILGMFATAVADAAAVGANAPINGTSGPTQRAPPAAASGTFSDIMSNGSLGEKVLVILVFVIFPASIIMWWCAIIVTGLYKMYKERGIVYENYCENCGHVGYCCERPRVVWRVVEQEKETEAEDEELWYTQAEAEARR